MIALVVGLGLLVFGVYVLGTAALLYPILKIGKNISRTEGAIYVISYMAFIYFTLV